MSYIKTTWVDGNTPASAANMNNLENGVNNNAANIALKANQSSLNTANTNIAAVTNTASLSGNGWFKDEKTGFLLQWGNGSCVASGNSVVTFPIAFPTACFNVTVGIGAGNATATLAANSISAANFQINNQDAYTRAFYYIAIGH